IIEALAREAFETAPLEILVPRLEAQRRLDGARLPFDAVDYPLEDAHGVAEGGPDELALRVLPEPVHAKRAHRERIAPNPAPLSHDRRRRFGVHGRGEVYTMRPVEGLGHERHGRASPPRPQNT